jgi:hypothetical protein
MLEYEIPKEWLEVVAKINEIGQLLRDDAISKNFNSAAEYRRCLNVLTGCYMFIAPEFKRWRAIKENNETAKFCQLKNESQVKFTAASGDKEASNFVGKERYLRDYLEGWLMAAESGIYTIKKHLDVDTKEERLS